MFFLLISRSPCDVYKAGIADHPLVITPPALITQILQPEAEDVTDTSVTVNGMEQRLDPCQYQQRFEMKKRSFIKIQSFLPQATELNYSLFVFGQARAGAPISGFFCPSV